jgi:hypothetical protein
VNTNQGFGKRIVAVAGLAIAVATILLPAAAPASTAFPPGPTVSVTGVIMPDAAPVFPPGPTAVGPEI